MNMKYVLSLPNLCWTKIHKLQRKTDRKLYDIDSRGIFHNPMSSGKRQNKHKTVL